MAVTKAMAGPRYQVVSGWDEFNREHGQIETRGEDEILTWASRGRMLDLARNQSRNSPTFNALLKQFDFNAIGTKGGKCSLMFENPQLMQLFSKYTRDCDFFDGMSFNSVLKLILRTYILGGDCVILFDDGLIEDSGKMVIYEPDEIGNTTDEALKARYGKFARQSLGKVYNGNSRWIGTIVSRACRGQEVFDP